MLALALPIKAVAGAYLNAAHGDTTDGVSRTSFSSHATGNCAHCHEQHASFDGDEPAPIDGAPSEYLLLSDNFTDQSTGACFICHVDAGSLQSGGLLNYSYSRRAGGWATDTQDDILEAFAYTSPSSSHNLDDIVTFITGKWGYTASSNPCVACHDPHAAQGDPQGSSAAKSSGTRGYPVSRPSQHSSTPWPLWGDDNSEEMYQYAVDAAPDPAPDNYYQAPYRFGSTVTFEPDGSATQDGSNLTDFNTFCTDCHNATNAITSTNLGRQLKFIDWSTEKHGNGDADTSLCGNNPYATTMGKVLSCTDCHEPHGSPNAFLIRKEVNGSVLGSSIGSFATTDWHYLCQKCHMYDAPINGACLVDRYYITHHSNEGCNTDRPYNPASCASCHSGAGTGCTSGRNKKICTECHFHGSTAIGRITF